MRSDSLSERLCSVAELVRQDAVLADIGTDHAYLPLFLLETGRVSRAFCSDVNEGPLNKARVNARRRAMEDKITFVLSDGADLLPRGIITDYTICGMGGELISDIISRSPDFMRDGVQLILQPMTRCAYLRRFLLESGYEIMRESYSEDDGKYYVAFLVRYTSFSRMIDDAEAEIAAKNAEIVNKDLQFAYLKRKKAAFAAIIKGKAISNVSAEREEYILCRISEYLDGARV